MPRKPRILDLFCGAGGSAVGYARAGFEVVGVDIEPQPHYPFEFHRGDALDVLAIGKYVIPDEFDAIHASPPCQHRTAYKRRPNHVADVPDLLVPTRNLLKQTGLPWVMENLSGKHPAWEAPFQLCGSMFALDVQRHRWFETNVPMMVNPCDHSHWEPRFPQATNRVRKRKTVEVGVWRIPLEIQQRAMDIDWMDLEELSEAVPPAYTEWIGARLLEEMECR